MTPAMQAAARPASMGIRSIAYHLPSIVRTAEDWGRNNDLSGERLERLVRNGVESYYDAEDGLVTDMAAAAIAEALERVDADPADIDMLIFSHTRIHSAAKPPNSSTGYLQRVLGLRNARCFSVGQQNCVSIFVALQLASIMAAGDPRIRNVLIVTSDHVPHTFDHLRVIADMAIHSDGACALLLTRDWPERRILSATNKANARSYRANVLELDDNPDYYVSTVATIRSAIAKAGLTKAEIARVLPNHVNLPSAVRVVDLMRMTGEALYTRNFARKGHVFGADPFINLVDCDPGAGENVLLYSTGMAGCYGAAVIAI